MREWTQPFCIIRDEVRGSLMPSLARAYIRSEVGQNKESLSVIRM